MNQLTYDTYGKVMWDTHLYTSQAGLRSDNVDEVLSFYEKQLDYVRDFRKKTGTEVVVGEFSLSNYKYLDSHHMVSLILIQIIY